MPIAWFKSIVSGRFNDEEVAQVPRCQLIGYLQLFLSITLYAVSAMNWKAYCHACIPAKLPYSETQSTTWLQAPTDMIAMPSAASRAAVPKTRFAEGL